MLRVIVYRAILDIPRQAVSYVSKLLKVERRRTGTRKGTRTLTCWWQAVYALVWFRNGGDIRQLGRGFGLSQSTSYRYLDEVIDVLAEQAPELTDALDHADRDGMPHLIIDGTLTDIARVREKKLGKKGKVIDAWFSGKARAFAANLQAIFAPNGFPLWISEALPGSVHDITTAREDVLERGEGNSRDGTHRAPPLHRCASTK